MRRMGMLRAVQILPRFAAPHAYDYARANRTYTRQTSINFVGCAVRTALITPDGAHGAPYFTRCLLVVASSLTRAQHRYRRIIRLLHCHATCLALFSHFMHAQFLHHRL